jgi:hypothetical protein
VAHGASTWQKAGTKGGFTGATFECQFTDTATAATTSQQFYRLLSYLCGYIAPATDIDHGGDGAFEVWTGAISAATDLDALPAGGVAENAIAYFADTLPATEYVARAGSPGDFLDLQIGEMETWYLHPDSKALSIVPKWEKRGDYWLVSLEAFQEAA